MGTSLARKYLGTVWTLIALVTLATYIQTVVDDGSVDGKNWVFVVIGLAIGGGLLFYERIRAMKSASAAPAQAEEPAPAAPAAPESTDPGA